MGGPKLKEAPWQPRWLLPQAQLVPFLSSKIKSLGYMSPRTQVTAPVYTGLFIVHKDGVVVGRSGRQEGALTLPLDHWGLRGAREWKALSHSMVPERVPHAHSTQASAHKSSHTDTHMLGGNKYSPYQRCPSPDTSGGVPPEGEELSAQFFKGGKGLLGKGKIRLCLHLLVGDSSWDFS